VLRISLGLFLFVWLTAACAAPTPPTTAPGTPEAIYTAAAVTMEAQMTLAAGGTAVAQLTEIAALPTATPPLPTTPPTQTPPPTIPPPSPTSTSCNQAAFVADVTTPENSLFFPGSAFTKIWRVSNTGACTWTPSYALVFAAGDPLGGVNAVFLPREVLPGAQVDLAVTLIAPSAPGVYRSDWLLRAPDGALFGVGGDASQPLSVQIQVAGQPPAPRGAYDFAVRACDATWRSSTAALGCPGSPQDANGSVVLLNQPYLESGLRSETGLWTRPDASASGRITGAYPSYAVRTGDRFRAELGCLADSPACDVNFRLDYRTPDGAVYNLGAWREASDGRTTPVNIDLSFLAGFTVQLLLSVENRGSAQDADAVWIAPYLETTVPQPEQVLVWNQQGGANNVCQTLSVTLVSPDRAEARANSCTGEAGAGGLTADELKQLRTWLTQLNTFDAEQYSADQDAPLISNITFNGRGSSDATNANITAIQSFAERLYNRIIP
jgi:hypothetical protein